MLSFALRQNKQVAFSGELFNARRHPQNAGRNGSDVVQEFFSGEDSCRGFKIFYSHARAGSSATAWDALREDLGIKVIHLRRRNILRRLISMRTAMKTDLWVSKRDAVELPDHPVCIRTSAKSWEESFHTDMQQDWWLTERFRDHQYLQVFYEDLVFAWTETTRLVQSFIAVNPIELEIVTRKQSGEDLQAVLPNFDALRRYFEDSSFKSYFLSEQSTDTE